jgi:hypothetical protein
MSWIDYTPFGFVVNQIASSAASGSTTLPSSGTGIVATTSRNDDIDAITQYIANAQAEAQKYPAAIKVINDYSTWLSNLSWYTRNFDSAKALSEAKYYRDQLNSILGRKAPADWVPADAALSLEIPTAKKDPTPKPPLIPTSVKVAIGVGGGATLILVLLKRLRVI